MSNQLRTVDLKTIERGYVGDGTYRLTVDGYFVGIVYVVGGRIQSH